MITLNISRKLRGGTALHALALLGAGVGAAAMLATPAMAQDYTSGSVSGSVVDGSNAPVANAQVTLRSQSLGQSRVLTTTGGGNFTATGLAPGTYDVSVSADGFKPLSDTVAVVAAQNNRITLTVLSTSAPDTDVVVTGSRVRQDFTKTTQGLNIDVVSLTKDVPVARSITGLILLAPTTNPGVTAFGNVASIGGSSVAENAYYINGLNITNPDTYVGSTRVPFDFYKTVDVQTAGYAAEFGRATGGVINATTKSGSNTPFMAIHGNFQPEFLQSTGGVTGLASAPTNVPQLTRNESEQLTIEGGGALIQDHLFVYGLFQPQVNNSEGAVPTSGYYETDKSTSPFYGGKVDAYITATQHLEFTFFDTTNNTAISRFNFTPNAAYTGGTIGTIIGTETTKTGGFNWVGRYTGNVTDFFSISGAYGINKDAGDTYPGNTASYFVNDRRVLPSNPTGQSLTISQQKFTGSNQDDTQRKFWRIDGDLRFSAFGQHHVRFGVDNEDLSETKITQLSGALPVQYSYRPNYVVLTYERLGGAISGNDRAFYLQDSWEPATGLTVNLGVRDDTFKQYNIEGNKYLDFKNNFAARVGFLYTPNGDSKFSFAGNYGRYYIPPAMNLGFRGHDDYFQEAVGYGAYTAATFPVDPVTGLPLANFGAQVAPTTAFSKVCPTNISAAPGAPSTSAALCSVFGNNTQDPAYAKVAPGTKPTAEDEFSFSARFQATHLLSFGVEGVYRKLLNVSEDTDFSPIIEDQIYHCYTPQQTGTAAQCARYDAGNTYYIWNPGKTSLTLVDWVDPTKTFTLTGLTFPKPKRTYAALTFKLDRADDGVWGLHGSVTLSKSRGNYEGTVKSDSGNSGQADAGATQDFDYVGLTDNSYGILPNDHALVFKSYGFIHPIKGLSLGYSAQVQSPMHGSCQGLDATTNPQDYGISVGYGAASYYCGVNPVTSAAGVTSYTSSAAAPRGTAWKSDWFTQIDFSVRFAVPGSNLVLRGDIFNAFNSKAVIQRYAIHESTSLVADPLYLSPLYYQTPRYARLGFDWNF